MPLEHRTIDRILKRLCGARGGTVSAEAPLRWNVEVLGLRFHQAVRVGEGGAIEIACDAVLDDVQTATGIAELNRELASAIARERKEIARLEDVVACLEELFDVSHGEDEVVVSLEDDIVIRIGTEMHEPWLYFSTAFDDDVSPTWLLETNAGLGAFHFESNDGIRLCAALPLVGMSAQKVVEIVLDLDRTREDLLDEANEPEPWEEETAIVGPYPTREAAVAALDRELAELGWTKIEANEKNCSRAWIHAVGDTTWISGARFVVARLAFELADARVFGAEVEYGPSGNRAVGVALWELALGDQKLVKYEAIGSEAVDADATDAALDWEARLAARAVGASTAHLMAKPTFYRET